MPTATHEAYRLMHEGALAMAEIEHNGIRVDTGYLDRTLADVGQQIADGEADLKRTDVWATWWRRHGTASNLGSREQLGTVLYGEMGFPVTHTTGGGKASTDEEHLERIDHPFIKPYLAVEKLKKLHGTYLTAVRRLVSPDGRLHVFYNLHLLPTYRSQSDGPNFQNIPIRDLTIGKYIRSAFVSTDPDHHLLEVDVKGAEVLVALCYHHDPRMLEYLSDPTSDMHRDVAREIFLIDRVGKAVRNTAKNAFTFPEFYGDYYVSVAQGIWDQIHKYKLATEDGVPIVDHLAAKGIVGLGNPRTKRKERQPGTFIGHIQEVEERWWGERFAVYDQWRRDYWAAYLRDGYFITHTGFCIDGMLSRNEVWNYPVQGSTFHCLLWGIIRLLAETRARGMRTRIVGQIHDSMLLDVPTSELADILAMVHRIMCVDLRAHWPWLVRPFEIEVELSPAGGTWWDKTKVGADGTISKT